jgi:hypothetical protein
MATLDSLPDELILGIVNLVDFPFLLRLNLVNRRLHYLTLELVYSNFPGRTAALFLRTVAQSPSWHNLAKLIKNIEWRMYLLPDREKAQNEVFETQRQAIAQAYRQLGHTGSLDVECVTQLRGTPLRQHWFLELFMSFLPNVESLKVYDSWYWDDHTYWFSNVAANPSRLKNVEIDGPLRIQDVHPLLTIPSMRDLTLHQVVVPRREEGKEVPWEHDDHRVQLDDASSEIESLQLFVSCLSTEILVELIGKFKYLRCFAYEHQPSNELQPEYEDFEVDEKGLEMALERHGAGMAGIDLV